MNVRPPARSATAILLFVCLGAFLLQEVFALPIGRYADVTTFGVLSASSMMPLAAVDADGNVVGGAGVAGVWHGEYWRLLTSLFLHGGVMHIFMNGFVLYSFAYLVEHALGWRRFVVLYLLSGLGGGAVHLLINAATPERAVLGASGALHGVIAAVFAMFWRRTRDWDDFTRQPFVKINGVLLLAWNAFALLSPGANISWEGHVGGFLVGFVLMLIFDPAAGYRRWDLRQQRTAAVMLAVGLASALFVGCAPFWTDQYRAAQEQERAPIAHPRVFPT